MCGIFGMILAKPLGEAKLVYKARAFITEMAASAATRGRDAAGFAVIDQYGISSLHREPRSSVEQIGDGTWHRALFGFDDRSRALLGHTRAATHGPNVTINAHPHLFSMGELGALVGTHNGIIYNDEALYPRKGRAFENDSANLFCYLSKFPESEWPDAFSRVYGWFALAMYRKDRIYLVRHSAPIVVADVPEFDALVYGSASYILKDAAHEAGVDMTDPGELQENRIYALTMAGELANQYTITPADEYHPSVMVSEHRASRGWSDYNDVWDYMYDTANPKYRGAF